MQDSLDYDFITGAAYDSNGQMYFSDALTAINAAVETRKDEASAPTMMRAIVEAQLPMPLVRDKYRAISQQRDAQAMVSHQSGVVGSGMAMYSRPTYSFNPSRKR